MEFKSYSDIENIQRLKFINDIVDHGLAYGEWVVTEKVHGSNFSFWVTKDSIKCAKRGGWIEDSEKNFYGHRDVLQKYNKNLCVLFHLISEFYNATLDSLNFTLYGEIFGGVYPHTDVPKSNTATRVQKGVYYTPNNDFYAFDLKVNGSYVNYKIFEEMMEASGFFWAKSLLIADMKTCMNYPNDFQTKIPEWLGLPVIDNNICEGVVIKPIDARFFPNHSRVILKNKNEKFTEVASKKVKQKKGDNSVEIIALKEENKALAEEAVTFVTENRLRNVISKIGAITDKDFGKLAGLFTQDVLTDFRKDKEERLDSIDKDQIKLMQNHIRDICSAMIKNNFCNIIDGVF